jgi:hypothetical protein
VESSTKEEKRQGSGVASADRSGTPGEAVTRRSFRFASPLLVPLSLRRTGFACLVSCFCRTFLPVCFACLAATLTVLPRAASVSRVEP